MSTAPPRRRRDAVEKRHAIERAATDLVLEHGYDAVTVGMISERAGVSPRTFFNHFPTKDAALLGTQEPWVDEQAADQFISARTPLLTGAAQLVRVDPGPLAEDPEYLARRIRAVGSSPTLMALQLKKIEALEESLRDIVLARLKVDDPAADADDLQAQASLITHLALGVLRYTGLSWSRSAAQGATPDVHPERVVAIVNEVLRRLVP